MENQITGTTCEGGRLDTFAAALANVTRSRAASLIKDGMVEVNGKAQTKPGFDLRVGDSVSVTVPEARPTVNLPPDLPIDILYEDDDLAVVVKPAGMVVHPAAGNEDGTLVNALLYRLTNLSGIGGEARPGIVHRLDKDTSGLLLVAKNDRAQLALSEQLADRIPHAKYDPDFAHILSYLQETSEDGDLLVIMGAGDISRFAASCAVPDPQNCI